MGARWTLGVDRTRCNGTGICVGTAPGHFTLDEGHRSHPRAATVDADDAVEQAAECCPTEAITVTDADTGEPLFPEP